MMLDLKQAGVVSPLAGVRPTKPSEPASLSGRMARRMPTGGGASCNEPCFMTRRHDQTPIRAKAGTRHALVHRRIVTPADEEASR